MDHVFTSEHPKRRQKHSLLIALIVCGMLSSVLYISTDLLAADRYVGYSYSSQAISELSASGAPTRPLVVKLFTLYNLLACAFGAGILFLDHRKRLRITGMLMILYGIVGQVTLLFFPMSIRGSGMAANDVMHIFFTVVIVLSILLMVGLAASVSGKKFRLYSIMTITTIFIGGIMAGMDGRRMDAGLPTPLCGIKERINVYSFLLWVLILAVALIKNLTSQKYSENPKT